MPSDIFLSEEARRFLDRLPPDYRALWDELIWPFAAQPMTEDTIPFERPGDPDRLASVIGPFSVIFRLADDETVLAISSINWGPLAPYLPPTFYRP